jgi:hypothetical protein
MSPTPSVQSTTDRVSTVSKLSFDSRDSSFASASPTVKNRKGKPKKKPTLAFTKLDINLDENFDENDEEEERSVSNKSFESSSSASRNKQKKQQSSAAKKRGGGGRDPSFDGDLSIDGEPSVGPEDDEEEEGDFDDEPPPDDDEVRLCWLIMNSLSSVPFDDNLHHLIIDFVISSTPAQLRRHPE